MLFDEPSSNLGSLDPCREAVWLQRLQRDPDDDHWRWYSRLNWPYDLLREYIAMVNRQLLHALVIGPQNSCYGSADNDDLP